MQKLMKAMHKNEKGFTLVELMVVVVIIGILVAIAIPIYNNVQVNAQINAHNANVRTLQGAATAMFAENAPLASQIDNWSDVTTGDTRWENYLQAFPVPELTAVPTGYSLPGDQIWATSYTVQIATTGTVTVMPGLLTKND